MDKVVSRAGIWFGIVLLAVMGSIAAHDRPFAIHMVIVAIAAGIGLVFSIATPDYGALARGIVRMPDPGRYDDDPIRWGVIATLFWGMAGFLTLIPLYTRAIGVGGAGPELALYAGIVIVLRAVGAKLPDRLGPVRLASSALLATAVGLVLIGVVPGEVGLLAGTAVFAVGVALSIPAILAFAVSRASSSERGSIVGTTSVFLDLSFGLAPVFLAPIADAAGIPATFIASAIVSGLGVVLLLARRAAPACRAP